MAQVEAVFQNGVFKPLADVPLAENQKVRLEFEPVDPIDVEAWMATAAALREELFQKHGLFPDSTIDIAEDRRRDE